MAASVLSGLIPAGLFPCWGICHFLLKAGNARPHNGNSRQKLHHRPVTLTVLKTPKVVARLFIVLHISLSKTEYIKPVRGHFNDYILDGELLNIG